MALPEKSGFPEFCLTRFFIPEIHIVNEHFPKTEVLGKPQISVFHSIKFNDIQE
jgi:hypothetical protein